VRIPVIEMVEIGAGGGSIAQVDKLRRIQVGPESAGSEPGPACYGRGGTHPAVTDADVRLGRIWAGTFAGGAFQLDIPAADEALSRGVADPLSMDVDSAAFGVSEVVDENMAAAARAHAAEFGLDLGSRDMVAFGGAAPLHAARLGEKLGVRRIIIPDAAGVGSAVGFLLAPVAYEVVRSRRQALATLEPHVVNALMEDMRREALAVVRQGLGPDVAADDLQETRHAYMRYVGQGHEISVTLSVETYGENHVEIFRQRFEQAYSQLYGRTIAGVEIEALSWTLTIAQREANPPRPKRSPGHEGVGGAGTIGEPIGRQQLFDPATGRFVGASVHLREDVPASVAIDGPALITEQQTTTVVPPGWRARMDDFGGIVLTREETNDE
jgi:N-methylhydantoinase A